VAVRLREGRQLAERQAVHTYQVYQVERADEEAVFSLWLHEGAIG
jgi:hypothetical protein